MNNQDDKTIFYNNLRLFVREASMLFALQADKEAIIALDRLDKGLKNWRKEFLPPSKIAVDEAKEVFEGSKETTT